MKKPTSCIKMMKKDAFEKKVIYALSTYSNQNITTAYSL